MKVGTALWGLYGAAMTAMLTAPAMLAQAQGLSLGESAGGRVQVDAAGASGDVSVAPSVAELKAEQEQADTGEKAEAAAPAPPAAGPTHVVREGDTLWGVSETYYQDPYAWPRLWSYNPQITNPHWIYPGDVLQLGPPRDPGAGAPELALGSRRAVSERPPSSVTVRERAYLDGRALEQSGTIMGSSATHMLLSVSDEAYVKFEHPPRAPGGREMTVYLRLTPRENTAVADKPADHDPEEPGEMVRVVGTLRILDYDPETQVARAEVVEALDVIERGFRVADVPRRYATVTPRTNQRHLESQVVAAVDPVEIVGQHQLVYLGIGAAAGVQPGNRFFVIRRQDGWRDTLPKRDERAMGARRPVKDFPDPELYPEDVVAELMVLHTRPETATAIVTHSVREITPGDRVRMPDGY